MKVVSKDNPMPNIKPVKTKKPLPTKKAPAKEPVPCPVLTEERVREVVRGEILKEKTQSLIDRGVLRSQRPNG